MQSLLTTTNVLSHCCFCSMQCALELTVDGDEEIVRAHPAPAFPVASGKACAKGVFAHEHARHRERLTTPLLRQGDRFVPISWEEALNRITERFRSLQDQYGRDSVAVFGGGSLTNEKAYLLGKFARVALGTANIDYNGRYCMSSAAAALNKAFGLDRGMTVPLSDIPLARCILIVGSNIAECQPTMIPYLRQAKAGGAKVIVVDPRRTQTAKGADLHAAVRPGSDVALMNGILHILLRDDLIDWSFIEKRTLSFEAVRETVAAYTPERVAEVTGVPASDIEQIARWYGTAETAIIFTARGIEQQARGVDNVLACINLVLATGQIGRPGSGFGAVTGQANGQGGREHGMKADQLPGYRMIDNPVDRQHIANVWGVDERELPGKGMSAYELFEGADRGDIRGMFVMASNPATSSPNTHLVKRALQDLDFLVVTDLFLTETAQFADVVLPGSAWTEDEGTMTNLEGRIVLRRAAQRPPGEARLDWQILCELAERLGKGSFFAFEETEDIYDELRRASAGGRADYAGASYQKIAEQQGVFWPCPNESHSGTERMFADSFAHPHGKAVFHAVTHRPLSEEPDRDYPLHLTNGRLLHHYLTGVQTRRTSRLHARDPHPQVEMHPATAARYGVVAGETVEIATRRGSVPMRVKITADMREDLLFAPIHWEHAESINLLTLADLDPISRMPEFKHCAAALRKWKGDSVLGGVRV
ncbi:nitrate reductase [Tumebacillus sp. DT12]|uniref:Nitrate reductase n=1 Tax=Tumebacillus lacus TaxID=2995335 RepID=A0ABT3WUY0_9BACL|nr:nitrate reductase [Tumebacillus lacus]MCX7568487.1 nitrate reductase [Tumebacillus lacus]